MALSLIADGSFTWRGDSYTAEVYQEGASVAPKTLRILKKEINLRRGPDRARDVLLPYLATRFQFGVKDQNRFLIDRLRNNPESDFRCDIKKGGSLFLRGRLAFEAPRPHVYADHPRLVLTCYDAAKRLDDEPWDPLQWDVMRVGQALARLLEPAGFGLDVHVVYDWTVSGQQSGPPAINQQFPVEDLARDLEEPSRWEVLKRLLTLLNAQLWQEDGHWMVVQRSARRSSTTKAIFDSLGAHQSNASFDPVQTVTDGDVVRTSPERTLRPVTHFRTSRAILQQRLTPNPNLTFFEGPDGYELPHWEAGVADRQFSNHFDAHTANLSPGETMESLGQVYLQEGESLKVQIEGTARADSGVTEITDVLNVAEVRLETSGGQVRTMASGGAWVSSVVEIDAEGGSVTDQGEVPFEVDLEGEAAPLSGVVTLTLRGPASGSSDEIGRRYARARTTAPSGDEAEKRVTELDLERPGRKREATFCIGNPFTYAHRGVVEYKDTNGNWQPAGDWNDANGMQNMHTLRVVDEVAQLSEHLNGIRFLLPPDRGVAFSDTIEFDSEQYVPVATELGPEGPRGVLAFDLHNLATDVPDEYVLMAYYEGFEPPNPPRMEVETEEKESGGTRYGVLRLYPNYAFAVDTVEARAAAGGTVTLLQSWSELSSQTDANGTVYYETQVELRRLHVSQIQARVTWNRAGRETLGPYTFDYDDEPDLLSAQLYLDASGQVQLAAKADTDTSEIKLAFNTSSAGYSSYPSDYNDQNAQNFVTISGRNAEDVSLVTIGQGGTLWCTLRAVNGNRESGKHHRRITRPIDVPWPIRELEEGPDDVTYRLTLGDFDSSVSLRLVYETYDASDNLLSAKQTAASGLGSESAATFTVSKDSDQKTRLKFWLENEDGGARVSEYEWTAIGRAAPTMSVSYGGFIQDGWDGNPYNHLHYLDIQLGYAVSGWKIRGTIGSQGEEGEWVDAVDNIVPSHETGSRTHIDAPSGNTQYTPHCASDNQSQIGWDIYLINPSGETMRSESVSAP